jgi:ABC-2 type transport system permease protein
MGSEPRFEFFPWFYSPVLIPRSKHPLVKSINAVRTEFVSKLDTVFSEGVRKTILLESSQYSRIVNTPARIALDLLRQQPDLSFFDNSYVPVAVLLEGSFESAFRNRLDPEFSAQREIGNRDYSEETKMIVVADADIIRNQIQFRQGSYQALPLGMDKYNGRLYGNRDFVLNAINYLCDDKGLLEMRTRELSMRLLDKAKIEKSRSFWQLVNVALPIVIIVLIGLLSAFLRKRRYATKIMQS